MISPIDSLPACNQSWRFLPPTLNGAGGGRSESERRRLTREYGVTQPAGRREKKKNWTRKERKADCKAKQTSCLLPFLLFGKVAVSLARSGSSRQIDTVQDTDGPLSFFVVIFVVTVTSRLRTSSPGAGFARASNRLGLIHKLIYKLSSYPTMLRAELLASS